MVKKLAVFEELNRVSKMIPYPLYWTDTNIVTIGANESILNAVGDHKNNAVVGKTPYDFYEPEAAKAIVQNHLEVIATKKPLHHDEEIKDIATGETKYFTGIRGPIFDEDGNVVGVIGASIDVTSLKEAEKKAAQLQLETKLQQTRIIDQEIFKKDVGQLIHDISTPIGTIQMILENIKSIIPESERITLISAIGSIKGMTGNLLSKYKKDQDQDKRPFNNEVQHSR